MKILVVDDDRDLRDILVFAFRKAGYLVVEAADGEEALTVFEREAPDLVVLDVNMPKLDGFEVCRRLRARSSVQILMLTVRGEEADLVRGLDLGADDYMAKPFSPQTLLARVRALLRRAGMDALPEQVAGRVRLDVENQLFVVGDAAAVKLTRLELRLLQFLLTHAGHVVRTERLYGHVWGGRGGDRELLKQLVHRVRRKIERDPHHPTLLLTDPGIGYRLDPEGGSSIQPTRSP
jgi:DNA-binding response OmpR family regulator